MVPTQTSVGSDPPSEGMLRRIKPRPDPAEGHQPMRIPPPNRLQMEIIPKSDGSQPTEVPSVTASLTSSYKIITKEPRFVDPQN